MGVGKTVVFDGKMGMRKFGSAAPPFGKVACAVKVLNAAAICKIGERNRIIYTTNWNLGPYMEIIDTEFYAVYRALEHLKQQKLNKKFFIFL